MKREKAVAMAVAGKSKGSSRRQDRQSQVSEVGDQGSGKKL